MLTVFAYVHPSESLIILIVKERQIKLIVFIDSNRINVIRLRYMYDTNRQILNLFSAGKYMSSSNVHNMLKDISLVTVKRRLSDLTDSGLLEQTGAGRSVKYGLTKQGLLRKPIDVKDYLENNQDNRTINSHFNFSIFTEPYVSLFSKDELTKLSEATSLFHKNAKKIDINLHNKELLRFIIEFSWKTSQIEGNTYDLLSTERLLRFGEKSKNNTEYESQMIINQKEAFELILDDLSIWKSPSVSQLEQIHTVVGNNLNISTNLRKGLVGITGTNYRPLDNEFQIREALSNLFTWIDHCNNTYEKALISVLGISYIQPFVDGNKRTSRLLGNAILLSNGLAPLSYRSVDDKVFKEATLVFYEQNSVEPFKKIFIEQYIFASENYNIST